MKKKKLKKSAKIILARRHDAENDGRQQCGLSEPE